MRAQPTYDGPVLRPQHSATSSPTEELKIGPKYTATSTPTAGCPPLAQCPTQTQNATFTPATPSLTPSKRPTGTSEGSWWYWDDLYGTKTPSRTPTNTSTSTPSRTPTNTPTSTPSHMPTNVYKPNPSDTKPGTRRYGGRYLY